MLDKDKINTTDNASENEDEDIDLDELEKMSGGAGPSRRGRGILTPEI